MIVVERDSARKGFEISVPTIKKIVFIGDEAINNHPILMSVIRLINLPSYIYRRVYQYFRRVTNG